MRNRDGLKALVLVGAAAFLHYVGRTELSSGSRRNLVALDPKSIELKAGNDSLVDSHHYNIPDNEWCKPPELPPIDYEACDQNSSVNVINLIGGLTNALKFVLLSAIKSLEDGGKCFVVDEKHSIFPTKYGPFLETYFERMGIDPQSENFKQAKIQRRTEKIPWRSVWDDLKVRRAENTMHSVPFLGEEYAKIEGHDLKRNLIRRIWRPLPSLRDSTCKALERHIQGEEYIGISIREGDKSTEGFEFASMQDYINKIEEVVPVHFDGKVPLIFAATDSCDPLKELRRQRPDWRIVSECDNLEQHGFVLQDHRKWSEKQLRDHYSKFFVELFALAGAKVWIGVAYTNVSWVSLGALNVVQ
jgi:hypothetical protein